MTSCGLLARSLLAALLFFLMPGGLAASGLAPDVGTFLVAEETIRDPRFRYGVVLLVQHDQKGSAGLVINRGSRLLLSALLPETSPLAGREGTLSYGGPVEPEALLALVRSHALPPEPSDRILDDLIVTGLAVLESWPDPPAPFPEFRIFTGYAGWAPGQLDRELKGKDWRVVPGDSDMVFDRNLETLWGRLRSSIHNEVK